MSSLSGEPTTKTAARPAAPDTRAKRGRKLRQIDKLNILTAAADLFDRNGYDQAKMQDIAGNLGISKPTLYNFFAGKTDILEEIFEHIIRGADAILDEADKVSDGSRALHLFVQRSLAFGAANRRMMNVFMSDERSLPHSVRQRHNRWSKKAYRRLRGIVERAQPDSAVDPRIVTFAITAFVNQVGAWFSQKGELMLEDIADGFSAMLVGGIGGIGRD